MQGGALRRPVFFVKCANPGTLLLPAHTRRTGNTVDIPGVLRPVKFVTEAEKACKQFMNLRKKH